MRVSAARSQSSWNTAVLGSQPLGPHSHSRYHAAAAGAPGRGTDEWPKATAASTLPAPSLGFASGTWKKP